MSAVTRWLDSLADDARAFRAALANPEEAQQRVLDEIMSANGDSEYLRTAHCELRTLPIVTYDDIEPYVARICDGEPNVLTCEPVLMVEKTSGSTSAAKFIPYTATLRRQFIRALAPWMTDLYATYPDLTEGRAFWSVSPLANARCMRYNLSRES